MKVIKVIFNDKELFYAGRLYLVEKISYAAIYHSEVSINKDIDYLKTFDIKAEIIAFDLKE